MKKGESDFFIFEGNKKDEGTRPLVTLLVREKELLYSYLSQNVLHSQTWMEFTLLRLCANIVKMTWGIDVGGWVLGVNGEKGWESTGGGGELGNEGFGDRRKLVREKMSKSYEQLPKQKRNTLWNIGAIIRKRVSFCSCKYFCFNNCFSYILFSHCWGSATWFSVSYFTNYCVNVYVDIKVTFCLV